MNISRLSRIRPWILQYMQERVDEQLPFSPAQRSFV